MLTKGEALKKAKEMSHGWRDGEVELLPLKDVNRLIREIYSVKPYTFEELHDDMWAWDEKEKLCGKVVQKNLRKFSLLSTPGYSWGEFEENRFFPVTKAMEVQE